MARFRYRLDMTSHGRVNLGVSLPCSQEKARDKFGMVGSVGWLELLPAAIADPAIAEDERGQFQLVRFLECAGLDELVDIGNGAGTGIHE